MDVGGIPNVEHPELPAPAEYLGNALTTGDEDVAGPIGIPAPPAGVPGSLPSGDVALSGVVVVPMPTWANTGLPQKDVATAIMSNGLISTPQIIRSTSKTIDRR